MIAVAAATAIIALGLDQKARVDFSGMEPGIAHSS
jgi:hypothetical protein